MREFTLKNVEPNIYESLVLHHLCKTNTKVFYTNWIDFEEDAMIFSKYYPLCNITFIIKDKEYSLEVLIHNGNIRARKINSDSFI